MDSSTLKRVAVQAAIIAAVSACDAGMFRHRRQSVELPEQKQSEEEAQRRIQAAADRRARRNAKRANKGE